MLKSKLAIYVWGPASGATQYQEIGAYVEALEFTTIAPGGFGTMNALVRINHAGVPRPQFGMFARVAIYAQPSANNPTGYIWLGELVNPAYGITATDGDYIKLNALGIGNCLRDDPNQYSYTNSTAQAIAQAQLTFHTATFHELNTLLSTDGSQLFPDNPALLISQVYDGRTFEEILSDVALLAGDYNWGTEADPVQRDSAGFPLGRVFARKRALTSTDYTASIAAKDITQAEFTPTADRAYNLIEIDYANGASGVAKVFAQDSRLAADLSQGAADFRFRKYLRDLSSMTTVNATTAASIASTFLGLFEHVTYKGTMILRAARDGSGNSIPLWSVQAGYNLYVPDYAISSATLPTAPTQNSNLFWISQTTYREDSSGAQTLTLQLGYLPDWPEVRIARLQMASDALARSGRTTNTTQSLGAPMTGYYGWNASNALAGQNTGAAVQFPALGYQAPTSLTFSAIAATNIGALSAIDFRAIGVQVFASTTANGATAARGTYQTNGNCLRAVNAESGRFAKHCDGCDGLHTDLAIPEHALVLPFDDERAPGRVGLSVVCPGCGRAEAFNTGLTEADEVGVWAHRAEQARLIRALMGTLGLERA